MGYEMKTRSAVAKSLSFWLQWDRGPLGLCCVCLHMNKPGGALCDSLDCRAKLVHWTMD